MEVLQWGYRVLFSSPPPPSPFPISLPSYSLSSLKGVVLREELVALLAKGAIELAPPSPGFYSQLRCMEDLGLMEACDRPVQSKWVCPSNPFQDGDQPVSPSVHSER